MLKQGLQVLFHIVMAKFPIPENCSAYVPMILKEFCSSKINGLVMKTFSEMYNVQDYSVFCRWFYLFFIFYFFYITLFARLYGDILEVLTSFHQEEGLDSYN